MPVITAVRPVVGLALLPILFLLFLPVTAFTQLTKIMGKVTDAETREPIPFVNILIPGTTFGILTDFEGRYALELRTGVDSIRASLLGYFPVTRKVQRGQFQEINFELRWARQDLPEVTIRYSGNPAETILKKVIQNREKNSLQSFNTYQYQAYTKIEIDANNISDKLINSRLFKPFDFVFDYVDTSTINGKSYLPVFLTETLSDIYFRKQPRSRKEIITASKVSGMENESVSRFLGNLTEEVDVYRDYIPLFEKNFVSPIASFAIDYYKYYLVDSAFIGSNWCYHLAFKPRRKQELTFTGSLWVADTAFAVRTIEMRMAGEVNVNFINDLTVAQTYEWTAGQFWMLTRDEMLADFNIVDNARRTIGFYGKKTTSYRDFQFDIPESHRFFSLPTNVFVESDAMQQPDSAWTRFRHEQLSKNETGIYQMVDSVRRIPIFNTYMDIIYGLSTGYIKWGKFEFGPWYKVYSFNEIEGNRFRIGGRTANRFSKKIQLQGHLAYGTKDKTLKGGGDLIWMFDKLPRRDLTLFYKWDVEQLGMSYTAFSSDNILSSLFHRGPNNKLTMVQEFRMGYEHEWFPGLINTLTLTHRQIFPLGNTEFILQPNTPSQYEMSSIFTTEMRLDARISFKERFVNGEFYRLTISSDYPIFLISYTYGFPHLLNSDFEYHKLTLNMRQWFNFGTIGWSKYIFEYGKIWGRLPYPLLRIHDGNQTFFFDEYSSNLMNYYEFVSDAWFIGYYTHHFDGLILNKIPLLRKLHWREVVFVKGLFGTLKSENEEYSLFPGQLRSFNDIPYWEAGVGIENIFKVFRVDAIWRLNHLDDRMNPNVSPFGLFASMNFSF